MNLRIIIRKIKRRIVKNIVSDYFQPYIDEINNRMDCLEYRYETEQIYALNLIKYPVKIHFINMISKGNVGDYNSGVYQYFSSYFSEYKCYFHNLLGIQWKLIQKGDYIIIGGGGLLNHCNEWNRVIRNLQKYTEHIIIWGAGENLHNDESCSELLDLSTFSIVGTRDKTNYFVPCPSCMLPQLSFSYSIERKFGVVEHKYFPIAEFEYDKIDNCVDIYTIIKFIGSSEVIISNSYHAIYWATLMKKKVIIYEKWSSKFDNLKWQQNVYSGNLDLDVMKCKIYRCIIRKP